MLMNRIIQILLLKHGRCVKGKQFSNYRDTGAPVTAAKIYDAQSVDELAFLDILASQEERGMLLGIVTETAKECFMPLTVGGGLKSIEDMKMVLAAGADKPRSIRQQLKIQDLSVRHLNISEVPTL